MEKRTTSTSGILCAIGILLYVPSGFAETATIVSAAPLYQRPDYNAPTIGRLDAGLSVQLKTRSGGWKHVTTSSEGGNKSGWVRSYKVRTGEITTVKQESSSGGFLSGLASLSRKASGLFSSKKSNSRNSQDVVATIGVRGLSEEELKNAKPNLKELKKMEKFRVNTNTAKSYARQGKRTAVKLAHMPKSRAEK